MKKRAAVIGGRPAPIHGAKEMDIDVVLIHEEGGYEADVAEQCELIVHADITDGASIIEALQPLHDQRPFDRIMTTTEFAGISTGQAVDHFGLPGVTERTATLLKDKVVMRELLAKNDLSPVAYTEIKTPQEAVDFVKTHGKSVLKPAEGVASLHILPCHDEASAHAAFEKINEANVKHIIIEEYLEGPVVSVDSFSFEGRHLPIGYSEYRMNNKFVEWEVSTPSSVAEPWLPELFKLTTDLLDVIELQEGPAHSEFILTPKGPRVLESHARLAGSGAPELVKRAFGLDLNRMFLSVPLGIDNLPEKSPIPRAGAAIQFFRPNAGRVRNVDFELPPEVVIRQTPKGKTVPVFLPFLFDLGAAERAVVIQKHEGDDVPPLNTVADCVSGYVLATGTSRENAVEIADQLVDGVRFEMGAD